jgi:hypothetical protein
VRSSRLAGERQDKRAAGGEEPKENKKFDEKILRKNYIQKERFGNQKPPVPPSSGKTTASDSSQVSKLSHIFPKEHTSKTD